MAKAFVPNRLGMGCICLLCHSFDGDAAPVSEAWQKEVSGLVWVAYSPTHADPTRRTEPSHASIESDLDVLRRAKFTGLVTYGSSGIIGRELPAIAAAKGFRGLIVGIWNPTNKTEIGVARSVAKNRVVLGYCMGNEGLRERYSWNDLATSIEELRQSSGKPVTTTEQIEDYDNADLTGLGDWVFPTVHPYFHGKIEPSEAVRWTLAAYARLRQKTTRFILLKEVGLPTAGDARKGLSEANQDKYYAALAKSPVQFVYFEAFDQPWKKHLPIEPHWGIFRSDRSPKILGLRLSSSETSADR